jgi:hypothetical protein
MDIFIEMRRIFLQGDECFFCNGKWFKNQDCKINLAQRNGIPGEIPFGVCTLPRLNMPTADRKAVFNGVKISRGKQGFGIWDLGSGIITTGKRVARFGLRVKYKRVQRLKD